MPLSTLELPSYLLYKFLVNVSLRNAGLKIRALQKSQEKLIHQLQTWK